MGNNNSVRNQLQSRQNSPHAVGTTVKGLLESPTLKKRFEEILRDRAPQYMSSIINLVNSDTNLQKCEPMTVVGSCMVAATLNLPVDKNLGYAWVIPYGNRAQFQLGYKGFIQLALRTAQYKHINAIPVYEGELISFNPLSEEIELDFNKRSSDTVIGYAAYFELLNGFRKTVYWTVAQVQAHRKRFSKQKPGGTWDTDTEAMSLKTVIKNMLSKWGILSVEMQKAFADDEREVQATDDGNTITLEDFTITDETQTDVSTATNESAATSEPGVLLDGGESLADGSLPI